MSSIFSVIYAIRSLSVQIELEYILTYFQRQIPLQQIICKRNCKYNTRPSE